METRTEQERRPLAARDEHVRAFKALAQITRLDAFFFLARLGREAAAGEIQEAVDVPAPTLSYHLDQLRSAGLVESRKEERHVYYSVRPELVSDLVRLLTDCC